MYFCVHFFTGSADCGSGTTNELDEIWYHFIASLVGDEGQLNNSLVAADKELTKEDDNILFSDYSGKDTATQLNRQAANVELSG